MSATAEQGDQEYTVDQVIAEIAPLGLYSSQWPTAYQGVIRKADCLAVLTESESEFNKIFQVIQLHIKFEQHYSTETGGKEDSE